MCRSDRPSGPKGLELASIHPVDVVIVDYFMPEMNGQEFAIRRFRAQAPIVMLSAAVDVPKQALKLVGAFVSKDQFIQPVVARDRAIARIPINPFAL
jgi:CheY-like chemotaxis protein